MLGLGACPAIGDSSEVSGTDSYDDNECDSHGHEATEKAGWPSVSRETVPGASSHDAF